MNFLLGLISCQLTIYLCSGSSLKMLSSKKYDTIFRGILERHNIYRQCHNAPPLELDEKLNRQAQKLADNLARHEDHSPPQGGNVFVLESNDTLDIISKGELQPWYFRPVDSWYREKTLHSENTRNLYADHFTQLVWKGSKKLGVGVSQSDEGTIFVVCLYDPSRNVESSFQDNVGFDVSSAHASDICILPEFNTSTRSRSATDSLSAISAGQTSTVLIKLASATAAVNSSALPSPTLTSVLIGSPDLKSTFGPSTSPSTQISTTGPTQPRSMPTRISTDSPVLTSILEASTWQSTSQSSESPVNATETSSTQYTSWSTTTTWNDTARKDNDYLISTSTVVISKDDELDRIVSLKTNETEDITKEMPERREFMTLILVLMSLLVVSLAIAAMILIVFILLKLFTCCSKRRCGLKREKRQDTDVSAQQPPSTLCVVSTSRRPGSPLPSRPASPPFQATSLTRLY